MLKTGAAALLLVLATPGLAQTPATPAPPAPPAPANAGPPPAFIQSAQAFGQCIGTRAKASDAKTTPEAAASAALSGCQAERTKMEGSFESWIAGSSYPEAQKTMARIQFKSQMASVQTQIADQIRQARANPAAK